MEKSYWRDAYELFCERYRTTIYAKHVDDTPFNPSDSIPAHLTRLLTPSDATKRQKSSERQLTQPTVVQGTPLLGPPTKKNDAGQTQNLRFPKLTADVRLTHYLRRKKLVTGLTPRITRKTTLVTFSSDPLDKALCNTVKAIKPDPPADPPKPPQKHRKLRIGGSQSPDRSQLDADKVETTSRKSVELEVVREISRPQTIETREKQLPAGDAEELNSSGILMTRKMMISTQVRASFNCVAMLDASASPTKPAAKKRKTKPTNISVDIKPTPEQSVLIATAMYHELNHVCVISNGMVAVLPDHPYKFYVGPGNNGQLVCAVMKKRWFWTRVDSWQQADFIWTQNKQATIVERLEKGSQSAVATDASLIPKPSFSIGKTRALKQMVDTERAKAGLSLISASESFTAMMTLPGVAALRLYNRIERNYQLTSKKRLFTNMLSFYEGRGELVFDSLPLTFLIQTGCSDPQFARFEQHFREGDAAKFRTEKPKVYNLWIIKPGENTNCGHGIHVSSSLEEIKSLVSNTTTSSGRKRSYIVQKYIERPLLVHKRKFDIRCYGMLTCFNGHTQGYFYHDGYLRTSSKEFTLKNAGNRFVHLTNDAVQKKSEDYGKFENGNKLSYDEFQKYLDGVTGGKVDFWRDLWMQIRKLMTDTFRAVHTRIDPHRRQHTFEILGYDFMIDNSFKVWLIEVNTNPCLALSSPYLSRLIPAMLDNAFRVAIDPYFTEPISKKRQGEWASTGFENRFELVFSSLKDAAEQDLRDEQISMESEDLEDSEETDAN